MSSLRDVSTGSLSVPATYRYTSTHIFISDTFLDEAANIISDTFLDEATGEHLSICMYCSSFISLNLAFFHPWYR